MNFIGLDFETSGLLAEHHAPIQLGMASEDGGHFDFLIGGWNWSDRPWTEDIVGGTLRDWNDDSAEIHGIGRDSLRGAPTPELVDNLAAFWIRDHFGYNPRKNFAVGWNTASFDFVFLRKWFPKTTAVLSYRSVDLNAIVFGIVEAGLRDPWGQRWTYDSLKTWAKDRAAHDLWEATGRDRNEHDAAYDAAHALHAFKNLQQAMKGQI